LFYFKVKNQRISISLSTAIEQMNYLDIAVEGIININQRGNGKERE
jgi:hypothetical protein